MKKLILVNGTMGVGKTTVCQHLRKLLTPSVFLDGDWCWAMEPFTVTEETKALVEKNVQAMLENDLSCPAFSYVIFCWVMHQEEIVHSVLDGLKGLDFVPQVFTLTCSPEALERRVRRDVGEGIRTDDSIARSLARLPLYDRMDTVKIDVTHLDAAQAAERIAEMVRAVPVV